MKTFPVFGIGTLQFGITDLFFVVIVCGYKHNIIILKILQCIDPSNNCFAEYGCNLKFSIRVYLKTKGYLIRTTCNNQYATPIHIFFFVITKQMRNLKSFTLMEVLWKYILKDLYWSALVDRHNRTC